MRTMWLVAAVAAFAVLCVAETAAAPRPRVELSYFGSRGRAEPIRFLLEVLEVPYTDRRFQSREEWLSVKESGAFAFNQVPGLRYCPDRNTEEGCMDVVQSHTIMRFLSRKFNSYLDEEDRVWVDMVADGAEDFRSRLSKLVYSPDGPDKINDHLETTLPQWLGFFERLKAKIHDGKKNFFVADTLTHADLYLFLVIEAHIRLGGTGILDDFPLLTEFYKHVAAHDRVLNWRISRRRPEFSNGDSASLDCPKNPPPFNDFGKPWPVPAGSEL